ncbi:hypothetical protein GCK32_022816 [Trichostrongylus colubriformis]|uniref:Uncharacterized protein n=1 Tax=Trichostrongylus colubriformis TaxID=6319 RepID=A0AAN8J0Q0_TRICO
MAAEENQVPPVHREEVVMSLEEYERLLAQANQPVIMAPPVPQAPSSATKPSFTKPGLQRQFEFNASILDIISPIAQIAPDEFGLRINLNKAVTSLTQKMNS